MGSRELQEPAGTSLSFQFQMSKKERKTCNFEMDFKKSFSVAVLM